MTETQVNTGQVQLLETLKQLSLPRAEHATDFIREWYVQQGVCYFFVFRKNLAITNIQNAELLSLLEVHARRENKRASGLQFSSLADFTRTVDALMGDFSGSGDNHQELFAELYWKLLYNTVVIQPLFGTCAVYLPPGLDLDLERVVGESGYIHFAGRCVYISEAKHASEENLRSDLDFYLNRFCPNANGVPFLVYSHEDWDEDDSRRRDQTRFRDGVHDLKIYFDRAYLGPKRLASIIAEMKSDQPLAGKLWFPKRSQRHLLANANHSFVLLRDYNVGNNLRRGEVVHYILYDQLLHNQNPCHLFEENKPGWSGPITAPHTLFGAMLNLPRPYLPDAMSVCDPFVGSGTTACEAAKIPNVQFTGSDLSYLSEFLVNDNLGFFGLSVDNLKQWENQILEMEDFNFKIVESNDGSLLLALDSQEHSWINNYVRRRDGDHIEIDEVALAEALNTTVEAIDRLIHYMALRFVLRNEGALLRGSSLGERKTRDIEDLLDQIKGLKKLRSCKAIKDLRHLQIIPWTISPAVVVAPKSFSFRYSFSRLSATDPSWKEREGLFDVIVTDPPYGYNTQERVDALSKLYAEMIPIMIKSLRADGHLIMCLPERSYTGRRTYSFTHKGLVIKQVLMAAKSEGFEVLTSAVPTPIGLYRPPYYWRSEKALSRSVIYFRLRKSSRTEPVPTRKKPR